MVVLEFSRPTVNAIEPLYDAYSLHFLPLLGKIVTGDAESYRYLAESIRRHPPQDVLLAMLEEALPRRALAETFGEVGNCWDEPGGGSKPAHALERGCLPVHRRGGGSLANTPALVLSDERVGELCT